MRIREWSSVVCSSELVNAESVEDTQQHIGRFADAVTHLGRENKVAISGEGAVDSADKDGRARLMRVAMRIAHVASLVDQHMVQNAAVSVGNHDRKRVV